MRGIGNVSLAAGLCLLVQFGPAAAQDVDVEGISEYYCGQLGGIAGGGSCSAPYAEHTDDACSIYAGLDRKDSGSEDLLSRTTASCSAEAVLEAKKTTLRQRADLRGYVSFGSDESVNDPVSTPDFRPDSATYWSGERYFAAECAVRTCADGGGSGADGSAEAGTYDLPPIDGTGSDDGTSDDGGTETAAADGGDTGDGTAADTQDGQSNPYFTLRVCNESSTNAFVAVSARESPESSDWYVQGWWKVLAGNCETIATLPRRIFYVYADGEENSEWTGTDLDLCVDSRRFKRQNYDGYTCGGSERIEGFYEKDAEDVEIFTWTLTE
ncbi:MAG TPA: DUF1036 domain-containing protein [Pseudorhizobium sp.]|nr:DUF1036 domain-containing protein [Pseudorhizobium sp.]